VLEPESTRALGSRLTIAFRSDSLNFVCTGEIMRITATGLGVRFIRLPAGKKRDIRRILKNRFALRQKVDIPCRWAFRGEESESRIVDLSSSGCYVHTLFAGLKKGSDGEVKVALPGNRPSYTLPGQVVWTNRNGAHEKPAGFGFKFEHRQPGFMKEASVHYGQGMLVR
jgi:hypothetical protein